MKKTDSEIQQAVLQELKWDTRVEETDVGVEVDAGVVTLTGTVSSWAKRLAAQEAAHRVAGVLDVANDIQVKMSGDLRRTDTDIAHAVRHALEWNVFVPEEHIRSTVADGWVTLEGNVDYWSQREDADEAVRRLAGVRGVTNKIEVTPPRCFPPMCELQLKMRWSGRPSVRLGGLTSRYRTIGSACLALSIPGPREKPWWELRRGRVGSAMLRTICASRRTRGDRGTPIHFRLAGLAQRCTQRNEAGGREPPRGEG